VLINELAAYPKRWSASWRVRIPVFPIDPKGRLRPRHWKHILAIDVEACRAATRVVVNISRHPFVLCMLCVCGCTALGLIDGLPLPCIDPWRDLLAVRGWGRVEPVPSVLPSHENS
jgi:hypothetical protein